MREIKFEFKFLCVNYDYFSDTEIYFECMQYVEALCMFN